MKRNGIIFKDPAKQAAKTIPGSDALAGKARCWCSEDGFSFLLRLLLFERQSLPNKD